MSQTYADYSKLAKDYDAYRTGYSGDLYAVLADYGLQTGGAILDVACGTALAAEPLAKGGAKMTGVDTSPAMIDYARERIPEAVWVQASAEALPFGDASFDGVICAQSFHRFERAKAVAEMVRVLKRDGVLAIWWKHLMSDDPVHKICAETAATLGVNVPDSALKGGFVEFYSAPLSDHTLRVIPWRFAVTLDRFLGYERSRRSLHDVLGSNVEAYIGLLRERLTERFGPDAMLSLGYLQFLYLGKRL